MDENEKLIFDKTEKLRIEKKRSAPGRLNRRQAMLVAASVAIMLSLPFILVYGPPYPKPVSSCSAAEMAAEVKQLKAKLNSVVYPSIPPCPSAKVSD